MTKEEVLQKANEYCTERTYTSDTLTDDFKDKFSENFAKRYAEETSIDAEGVEDALKFSLDTVFSATSKWAKDKLADYTDKENDYKRQIAELQEKLGKKKTKVEYQLPKEIEEQIEELKMYKNAEVKKTKFSNIIELAKKGIRQDLHKSFETFANGTDVSLEKGDKEQADALVSRFQEIFKDSIGDIKPLAPQVIKQRDGEMMSQLKRIKV